MFPVSIYQKKDAFREQKKGISSVITSKTWLHTHWHANACTALVSCKSVELRQIPNTQVVIKKRGKKKGKMGKLYDIKYEKVWRRN